MISADLILTQLKVPMRLWDVSGSWCDGYIEDASKTYGHLVFVSLDDNGEMLYKLFMPFERVSYFLTHLDEVENKYCRHFALQLDDSNKDLFITDGSDK